MKKILLFCIRSYQYVSGGLRTVGGPFVVATGCKFYPTCSEYAIQAVEHYGPFHGSVKAAGRLCRCHPWARGGVDYP